MEPWPWNETMIKKKNTVFHFFCIASVPYLIFVCHYLLTAKVSSLLNDRKSLVFDEKPTNMQTNTKPMIV